jgi:hypothetical protein
LTSSKHAERSTSVGLSASALLSFEGSVRPASEAVTAVFSAGGLEVLISDPYELARTLKTP